MARPSGAARRKRARDRRKTTQLYADLAAGNLRAVMNFPEGGKPIFHWKRTGPTELDGLILDDPYRVIRGGE